MSRNVILYKTLKKENVILMLMFLFGVFTNGSKFSAIWLKNNGVLQLISPWQAQTNLFLEPVCPSLVLNTDMIAIFQKSYRLSKADYRILTHMGRSLWMQGLCDDAISHWNQSYQLMNDFSAAFELFRVEEYDSFSSETRLLFADLALNTASDLNEKGKVQEAYQWYRRGFILVPRAVNSDALLQLYNASPIEFWQELLDQLPNTEPAYWWAIAKRFEQQQDWENAVNAYELGIELTSDPAEFWVQIGDVWVKDTNWNQAISAYQNALSEKYDELEIYISLGNIYRVQNQYEAAISWYEKAKLVSSHASDPYYYLGLTYYLSQDFTQASENLMTAISLSPNHASARYYLAQTWYRQNKLDLAESWLIDAINHHPINTPVDWWIQLGDWQLEQMECNKAQNTYLYIQELAGFEEISALRLNNLAEICP